MKIQLNEAMEKLLSLQNEFNNGNEATKLIMINVIINELNNISNALTKARSLIKDSQLDNLLEQK